MPSKISRLECGSSFRTDGKLFNLRRLQAKTEVLEELVRELLFADDCGLVAHSQEDMKLLMDRLAAACSRYGLTISLKRQLVLYQPAPGKLYVPPVISIGDRILEALDKFTYLGSTLSREATIDEEISNRIAKARIAFGRLRERLWDRKGISSVKDQAGCLQSCGYSSLLYTCETWTAYSRHLKKLSNFHLNCLRSLMRIKWQDKVPDTEVPQRSRITSVSAMVMKAQLRWSGHVVRMPGNRLPQKIFYGELVKGKRSQGGQRKR